MIHTLGFFGALGFDLDLGCFPSGGLPLGLSLDFPLFGAPRTSALGGGNLPPKFAMGFGPPSV